MANTPIWPGSSSFYTGSTNFGYYDTDTSFQTDADRVAKFCASRLGYPMMDVELQDIHLYRAFEEAVTVYGNEVYLQKIKDNYLNLEGSSTGSQLNNTVVTPNLSAFATLAEAYGEAAQIGGKKKVYKGMIPLKSYVQDYNVRDWVSSSAALLSASFASASYAATSSWQYYTSLSSSYAAVGSSSLAQDAMITASVAQQRYSQVLANPPFLNDGDKIEISRVFWQQTPGIVRFFDPYLGSGFNYQGMMESFGWGSLSPAVSYMMFPLFWDIERVQAIEMSDMVRRSNFSFELKGEVLSVFPIPGPNTQGGLAFEFSLQKDLTNPANNAYSGSKDLVTNISNVPYGNPVYSQINATGRYWIMEYTLAIAKGMLAEVRGKYSTIPIPGAETTLNSTQLYSDSNAEKAALLERLRGDLDMTSRRAQLERQQAEGTALKATLNEIPLAIFIG